MPDLTIIGAGAIARQCSEVLTASGFSVRHTFELDDVRDRSPVIIGEVQGAFGLARQALENGRHIMVICGAALPVDRIGLLLENRRRAQALFVWSERRYHPGYRFVSGLVEADATWRPRFLRLETLGLEPATTGGMRWRAMESLALIQSLTNATPLTVSAAAAANPLRAANDFLALTYDCREIEGYVQIGLGEAVERREAAIAAAGRKAFVDELNQSTPVRLVDAESGTYRGSAARWVSCPSPTPDELVRQQCFAFMEGTMKPSLAQAEAQIWDSALAVLQAGEQSLQEGGVSVEVRPRAEPSFRLIPGRFLNASSSRS